MSEPTKEELLARIAELEKKAERPKKGTLEFRVGKKAASASMAWGASRSRCITNSGYGCWMWRMTCAHFWKRISTG